MADDSHEAQEIMHKGLSSLESFPRQATAHLPAGLGAGLEGFGEHISGGVDPTLVQQRINKVTAPVRPWCLSFLQPRACCRSFSANALRIWSFGHREWVTDATGHSVAHAFRMEGICPIMCRG